MRKRNHSVMQSYSPTIRRRRISSNVNNLFISFPGYAIGESEAESNTGEDSDERLEKLLDDLYGNHKKIHGIIDEVDLFIQKRMQIHEMELITVVRKQIDKMQKQTAKVIQRYNTMIDEKNKEVEIYSLKNELDYFRSEALQLFELNKKLKEENQKLKVDKMVQNQQMKELEIIVNRLTKKYKKQKSTIKQLKQEFIEGSFLTEVKEAKTDKSSAKRFEIQGLRNMMQRSIQKISGLVELEQTQKEGSKRRLETEATSTKYQNMLRSFSNHKVRQKHKRQLNKSMAK